MTRDQLWNRFEALPSSARKEVMALLRPGAQRTKKRSKSVVRRGKTLADEPFIGMWSNRTDLGESAAWVKTLRRGEWSRDRG